MHSTSAAPLLRLAAAAVVASLLVALPRSVMAQAQTATPVGCFNEPAAPLTLTAVTGHLACQDACLKSAAAADNIVYYGQSTLASATPGNQFACYCISDAQFPTLTSALAGCTKCLGDDSMCGVVPGVVVTPGQTGTLFIYSLARGMTTTTASTSTMSTTASSSTSTMTTSTRTVPSSSSMSTMGSSTSSTLTGTATSTTTSMPDGNGSSGLSTTVIAVIAVGGVVGLLIIVAGAVWYNTNKRNRNTLEAGSSLFSPNFSSPSTPPKAAASSMAVANTRPVVEPATAPATMQGAADPYYYQQQQQQQQAVAAYQQQQYQQYYAQSAAGDYYQDPNAAAAYYAQQQQTAQANGEQAYGQDMYGVYAAQQQQQYYAAQNAAASAGVYPAGYAASAYGAGYSAQPAAEAPAAHAAEPLESGSAAPPPVPSK